jgi:hypothetical protein
MQISAEFCFFRGIWLLGLIDAIHGQKGCGTIALAPLAFGALRRGTGFSFAIFSMVQKGGCVRAEPEDSVGHLP